MKIIQRKEHQLTAVLDNIYWIFIQSYIALTNSFGYIYYFS